MNEETLLPLAPPSLWLVSSPLEIAASNYINQQLIFLANKLKRSNLEPLALDNPTTWKNLASSGHKLKILKLQKKWQKQSPYSDLSTLDILTIVQQHLLPVEQQLERAIIQTQAQLNSWALGFIHQKRIKLLQAMQGKLLDLTNLKQRLLKIVLHRAQASQKLNLDRHLDDDRIFMQRTLAIDAKDKTKWPYFHPRNQLSDDTRLKLYDILQDEQVDEKQLESLIKVNRQAIYEAPSKKSFVKKITAHLKTLEQQLGLQALAPLHSRYHPVKTSAFVLEQWLHQSMYNKLKSLKHFSYLIALFCTMSLYMSSIGPWMLIIRPFMPNLMAMIISNTLFYGLALSPIWVFAYKAVKKSTDSIFERIHKKMMIHCYDAYQTITLNQQTICSLQAGILDTPFYNIKKLDEQISDNLRSLDHSVQALKKVTFWEKWLPSAKILSLKKNTQKLLSRQSLFLKEQRQQFAKHIVKRVKQDLPKLQLDLNQQLVQTLPSKQLLLYKEFIRRYGQLDDLKQFEEATSLAPQFFQDLKNKRFHHANGHAHVNLPWGQFKPNLAALKGWQQLLSFSGDHQNLHTLTKIMLGEKSFDEISWTALVHGLSANRPSNLMEIQQYLFDCINFLPISLVHNLSSRHKTIILKWFVDNRKEIQKAEQTIDTFIKSPSSQTAPIMNESSVKTFISLLDGAKIAYHLQDKTFHAKSRLQAVLHKTDGSNHLVFYALRFMPLKEKKESAIMLAKKRVGWLLSHPQSLLYHEDIELLHAQYLVGFDLTDFIVNHPNFKHKNDPLTKRLDSFAEHGLIEDRVISQYINTTEPHATKRRIQHAR